MAKNIARSDKQIPNATPPRRGGRDVFSQVGEAFKLSGLFGEGIPTKHLPKVLWVAGLVLVYIFNGHQSNKQIVKLTKLKVEVEDLKVQYQITQSEYMYASKQSEVARKVAPFQIEESSVAPRKLEKSNN